MLEANGEKKTMNYAIVGRFTCAVAFRFGAARGASAVRLLLFRPEQHVDYVVR